VGIFDSKFKRLIYTSPRAVISFINGLFNTNHPLNSTVAYPNTEYVNEDHKHFHADSVSGIGGTDIYNIEVQSGDDTDMAIRIFRYGFLEANRYKTVQGDTILLNFPQARIIYLQPTARTPDWVKLRLTFPDGSRHLYRVKTFKLLDHSLEDLERQHLALLLPFYLLKLRKAAARAKTGEDWRNLTAKMKRLLEDLEKAVQRSGKAKILNRADIRLVTELTGELYTYLYHDYDELKEIAMVVPEKYLTEREKAELRGKRLGMKLGEERNQQKTAQAMKAEGLPPELIVKITGLPAEAVEKL
jgi:predicted transposase/invertase (TIGR01784 family)